MRVNDWHVTFNLLNALKYPDDGKQLLSCKSFNILMKKQFLKDQAKLHEMKQF